MSKIIVIFGPTASGKTKLSVEVASYLNAEIINADAVQIYKDVNIGSAKTTKEEMKSIKHHMIDFNSLDNKYTIYDYQKDSRKILDNLIKENKNIVIVGGSGLYIKTLLFNYELESEIKTDLNKYERLTNEELKSIADSYYKQNGIHINNRNRLIRFVNHYEKTNKIIKNSDEKDKLLYDAKFIGLKVDREELYSMINNRVDKMMESGLLKEAKKLFDKDKNTDAIIGYKELNRYFRNEMSLKESIELIKKDSRHYAKRQYTWFINQFKDVTWVNVDYNNFNKTIEETINILKKILI